MIVDYDAKFDTLLIHKGFAKDEKFKGNLEVGDIVLDISTKGRVKGVEIMNASEFLKEWCNRSCLKSIEEADFSAAVKPTSIILSMKLKGSKEAAKIAVALPAKLNA